MLWGVKKRNSFGGLWKNSYLCDACCDCEKRGVRVTVGPRGREDPGRRRGSMRGYIQTEDRLEKWIH